MTTRKSLVVHPEEPVVTLKGTIGEPPAERADPAVKRSVTVRRDLHDAILNSVGAGQYSAFLNEALVMALQARGIDESLAAFEAEHGALTAADFREAERRRAEAATDAGG